MKNGLFFASFVPQNVVTEGYKHKNFLFAPLAALFYTLSHVKMASSPMIAMINYATITSLKFGPPLFQTLLVC